MKKSLLVIFSILSVIQSFSQREVITLTFSAKDSITQDLIPLDSINILNLEEDCDTTLYDPVSVLILDSIWPVGINEPAMKGEESCLVMQNIPNPFRENTQVRVYLKNDGDLALAVFDSQGRSLSDYCGHFVKGWHLFNVSANGSRLLFLRISDAKTSNTVKLISAGPGREGVRISYSGSTDQGHMILKSSIDDEGFIFFLGTELMYTAYADGYYESIMNDAPVSSVSYVFNMLPLETADIPTVTTSPVTDITQTTATSGGNVTADGGAPVTARGVCWSTIPGPTADMNHTTDGVGTGIFISLLTWLTPNTPYYIRAYATNSAGTAYGEEMTFTTLAANLPTVITAPVTFITQTSATSGGNVTSDGGDFVSSRGVCWGTSPAPDISGSHTMDGGGLGSYESYLYGLTPSTPYYIRAYATNSAGTAYGDELIFTTLSPTMPTVTTTPATNITPTTATTGGNVNSDGGAPVTERGVCWSLSPNPSLSGDHTSDGSGMGMFVSNLTGLTPDTLYYIRAYAINSVGTAYGNELTFTTLPPAFVCGEVLNYEGQDYNTVLIGSECWLRENLNVGTMINSPADQSNNGIVEKYCYNNDPANCEIYGGLYQWNEMMQYTLEEGAQGICPVGWHLPTDGEYTALVSFLGGEAVAGGKMKETGTVHWSPPNTGATNESGYTALPGGSEDSFNGFLGLHNSTRIWTSTPCGIGAAWRWLLSYATAEIERYDQGRDTGMSVRCIKD